MNNVITRKTGVEVTENEIELVQMVANGHRAASIGAKMGKSRRTIESKLDNLRRKTGSETVPELIANFMRAKLIN